MSWNEQREQTAITEDTNLGMGTITPAQSDEFTCGTCFLVRHTSTAAIEFDGMLHCRECFE